MRKSSLENTHPLPAARATRARLHPPRPRTGQCTSNPLSLPATSWPESLPDFGQDTPLRRAGQPAELAPAYVFLADPASSYVSGAIVPVTGGKPL